MSPMCQLSNFDESVFLTVPLKLKVTILEHFLFDDCFHTAYAFARLNFLSHISTRESLGKNSHVSTSGFNILWHSYSLCTQSDAQSFTLPCQTIFCRNH